MNILRLCSATALLASAFAANAASPASSLEGCVDLAAGHEIVRAGSTQSFLLRDGDDHYRVLLRNECGSLPSASRVTILSDGTAGRLCASGARIKTDRDTCMVRGVEAIGAEEFASAKRRARR